jgi:hypothetical protein
LSGIHGIHPIHYQDELHQRCFSRHGERAAEEEKGSSLGGLIFMFIFKNVHFLRQNISSLSNLKANYSLALIRLICVLYF